MENNNYNQKLKFFARANRKESTKAEIKLWCELLRNKQMMGYAFLRQRPIGNYIADFFSKDLKLIIEVDGLTHQWKENSENDLRKEIALREMGFSVIRFHDSEVMNDIDNVNRTIENFIFNWETNHPPTPFEGGASF